jgi:hypothetical protein
MLAFFPSGVQWQKFRTPELLQARCAPAGKREVIEGTLLSPHGRVREGDYKDVALGLVVSCPVLRALGRLEAGSREDGPPV